MAMLEGAPNPNHKVCKLVKYVYGLKRASRHKFARLNVELEHHRFVMRKK